MEINKKGLEIEEDNFFNEIMFRFFPYWPLFLGLFVISIILAFSYLLYVTPTYSISATLLIKDEKKGIDDPSIMQSLNISSSTNIVENEIEVLHSRALLNEVVMKLNLYAPIYSDGPLFKTTSAYTSSPVIVQVKNPEILDTATGALQIYFTYDSLKQQVKIENKNYPLNEWIKAQYGTFKFIPNPKFKNADTTNSLYFTFLSPKLVVASLSQNLVVDQSDNESTIVTLTLPDQNIQRGKDIVNELIYAYNRASVSDQNQFAAKTLATLSQRMVEVQHQVDSIQNLINRYKVKNGIVDLTQQSLQYLQNVGNNDQQLSEINRKIAVLEDVEKYVNSKDQNQGIIPSTLELNNPVLSDLLKQLYDLEINYEKVKMTASDNNPTVISLSKQILKTKSDILENIKIARISLNASHNNLNQTANTYSSQLKNIPDKEKALVEISRELTVLTDTYNFLLQKKEETSLTFASTIPDSRIVDLAEASIYPSSPNKLIVLAVAIVLAMGTGLFIVLKKEVFNPKLLFRSDIDKSTHIPVVGEIVDLKENKHSIVDIQKNPVSTEQFHHLAAAIGLYDKKVHGKKLFVTSSIKGEGKTLISTNLAITLASSGKKVIILDMDLRNPQLSSSFNIDNEVGVAEFLEGGREPYEIIKHSEYDNLFIAPAGTVQSKINELLLNGKLNELFNYLEEVFDFIIVDTPPIEPVSDAYILSAYSDSTLFVVRHRYTPKAIVRLLDQNNKIKSLKNVAIVFNGVKARGFIKHAYGYGYGFGYEYVYKQSVKEKKGRKAKLV